MTGSHPNPGSEPNGLGPGYEVRDTNVRAILIFLVGLVLFLVVVQVGLWGLLKAIMGGRPEPPAPPSAPEAITEQLHKLRADEDARLSEYRWVDKKGGPVGIKIDRAIEILSERGIPPTPGPPRTEAEVNSHSGSPAEGIR